LKTTIRKSMLYKTGVEYGDYTMNHVQGCSHGCLYPCYAFLLKKRFGQIKSYEQWIEPVLVSNTLELLDKEIPRMKDKIQSVHLCFTTDPFMYGYPEISDMSIAAIRKLNAAGVPIAAHRSVQLTRQDYDRYDYIIGMDSANIRNMHRILGGDPDAKIHKLTEYSGKGGDIADPWYSGDFSLTYREIYSGCAGLLEILR